jgi:YHS domain-containing protein
MTIKTTFILCIFALVIFTKNTANATSELSYTKLVLSKDSIDVICKMKVKNTSKIYTIHKEKRYNFCNISCKTKFDKNPEKYIKK